MTVKEFCKNYPEKCPIKVEIEKSMDLLMPSELVKRYGDYECEEDGYETDYGEGIVQVWFLRVRC